MKMKKFITIAAHNTSQKMKAEADVICNGKNDQLAIQKAIEDCVLNGQNICLLNGTYVIDEFYDLGDGGPRCAICVPNCNREILILGQNFKGSLANSGEPWKKLYTQYDYEEGTFPWFPQLTVQKPTSSGYFNILSKDGTEIYEYLKDPKENMKRKSEGKYIGKKRVVFTKAKDPLTGIDGYRFVGFFIGDHYDENGTITYKRIDDKFRIIKK